jgi:hypothetical protein
MSQQDIEEMENEVVEDVHFHYPPHNNVLRCPNPVLIIDTRTGSHFFMVSGDYVPDDDTDFDHTYFYLVQNSTIDNKTSVDKRYIFHLELNSDKLDENGNPIKKFRIRLINRSRLDKLHKKYFVPNVLIPPRVPSRGMYDGSNPVSVTPENIGINEEDDLITNKKNL